MQALLKQLSSGSSYVKSGRQALKIDIDFEVEKKDNDDWFYQTPVTASSDGMPMRSQSEKLAKRRPLKIPSLKSLFSDILNEYIEIDSSAVATISKSCENKGSKRQHFFPEFDYEFSNQESSASSDISESSNVCASHCKKV